MAGITVRDVHVDAPLTNLSVGYHPSGFIAERVAKPLKVNKESDKYYVWNRDTAFRVSASGIMSLRADKSEAREVDFGLSTSTYTAEEYALKALVSDREKDNADSVLQLRESKVRRLQDLLLLEQEIRVATLLTTEANWDSGHYTTPSVLWDAASGVKIEKNIDDAQEVITKAIGQPANQIIIPSHIAKIVKRDSSVRELIKYTHSDLLVNGDLPPRLWNLEVIIPSSTYTASLEGNSTQTYNYVWGDDVVLLYNPGETSLDSPHSVKIFRAKDWEVRSWRIEEKRSEAIEASVIQDEVLCSNISGYLLKSVLT